MKQVSATIRDKLCRRVDSSCDYKMLTDGDKTKAFLNLTGEMQDVIIELSIRIELFR